MKYIQENYNLEHGIVPKTIIKEIRDLISNEEVSSKKNDTNKMSKKEKLDLIDNLTREMNLAAKELNFERAAELRDKILELKRELLKLE